MTNPKVTVIGAGSWGTALAVLLAGQNVKTYLWGHDSAKLKHYQQNRCNSNYLPDVTFPKSLEVAFDLSAAIQTSDYVLIAVPSFVFSDTLQQIKPWLRGGQPVIWGCKGGDNASDRLFNEVARTILGANHPLGVISGPSFAKEVAHGMPTAVIAASYNAQLRQAMVDLFTTDAFMVYPSADVVGVELCGLYKNVLAIATGLVDGLDYGANTRCALLTLGLTEARNLGEQLGAQPDTFSGLAGLGDLVLTCTNSQSRNRRFGLALAQGQTLQQASHNVGQVVEGIYQLNLIMRLAEHNEQFMPLCHAMNKIIHQDEPPSVLIQALSSSVRLCV